MIVIVISREFPPMVGGLQTYTHEVCQQYVELADRVYVVTQSPGSYGVSKRGRLVVFNVSPDNRLIALFRVTFYLRHLAFKLRLRNKFPSVIHATTWRMSLPAFLSRIKSPVHTTVHGGEMLSSRIPAPIIVPLMRTLLRHSRLVIGVSETSIRLARSYTRLTDKQCVVAYNGVSSDRLIQGSAQNETHASGPLRIHTLCRLETHKNVQGALKALLLIKEQTDLDFEYHVAGSGSMTGELMDLAHNLGLSDRVKFHGRIPDTKVQDFYNSADIFLHPQILIKGGSDLEGFGIVIADAMYCGLPVVVGRDGGPGDFVKDGETGLIVDGNCTESIAEAISSLLTDSTLRKRLGSAASTWCGDNLSWQRHAKSVLGI